MFSLTYFEPRVFAVFQPQVHEPEDPEPDEQLLVSNVQAVRAQHRRGVPLAVGVQYLGLGNTGVPVPADGPAGVRVGRPELSNGGWSIGSG
jgi:hypothetical protein